MAKADDYIETLIEIFSKEGNTQKARISMTAFISTLLGNWAFKTQAHKMDCLGILEMSKEMLNQYD
jgi:hypothetical protein